MSEFSLKKCNFVMCQFFMRHLAEQIYTMNWETIEKM